MPISIDFEQQLRGPWDTASGFLIEQLEVLQAQLAPVLNAAPSPPVPTYVEGSWLPAITGDGGGSGQTYTTQLGSYTKIGKQVTAWYYIILSNKGTVTGNVIISGLPFTTRSMYSVGAVIWLNTATAWANIIALIQSSTFLYLRGAPTASTTNNSPLTAADLTNTTAFLGTIVYFTP